MIPAPRQGSQDDIAALQTLSGQLAAFGSDVALDWIDGWLTALAIGRRTVPVEEWLTRMFDGNFERAYPDPVAARGPLAALARRQAVLSSQLHAGALYDQPDVIRLAPLMTVFDEDVRREIVASDSASGDEAADAPPQTGALWAEGFRAALQAFPLDPDPGDDDGYAGCMRRVMALLMLKADLAAHLAEVYPGQTLDRDDLIDDALLAVQDLHLYWIERAPKPETRRVARQPGRNDPCFCGSGRKFKKCHGAVTP